MAETLEYLPEIVELGGGQKGRLVLDRYPRDGACSAAKFAQKSLRTRCINTHEALNKPQLYCDEGLANRGD